METWKPDEKVEITSIFFKQIDRINIIMSERSFDIMQLARAVDALDCNTNFLRNRRGKRSKKAKTEKSESAVKKATTKKLSKNEMYELARDKISETMVLLDNNDMLISTVYEGEA